MYIYYQDQDDKTIYKVYLKSFHVHKLFIIKALNRINFSITDLNFQYLSNSRHLKEITEEEVNNIIELSKND